MTLIVSRDVANGRAWFEHLAAGFIAANATVVMWGIADHAHHELVERLELACLSFFCVELVVRLGQCGWRPGVFVRQPWALSDLALVGLSLAPVLPVSATALRLVRVGRFARLLHLGRHISGLRVLRLVRVPVAGAAAALAAVFMGSAVLSLNPSESRRES